MVRIIKNLTLALLIIPSLALANPGMLMIAGGGVAEEAGGCSATPYYSEEDVNFTDIFVAQSSSNVLGGAVLQTAPSLAVLCQVDFYVAYSASLTGKTYHAEIWKGGDGTSNIGSLSSTSTNTVAGADVPNGGWISFTFTPVDDIDLYDAIIIRESGSSWGTPYLKIGKDYNGNNLMDAVMCYENGQTCSWQGHNPDIRMYGE